MEEILFYLSREAKEEVKISRYNEDSAVIYSDEIGECKKSLREGTINHEREIGFPQGTQPSWLILPRETTTCVTFSTTLLSVFQVL